MSADNYVWLDVHPNGGWGLVMGSMSAELPPSVREDSPQFMLVGQACAEYYANCSHFDDRYWSEYGLSLSEAAMKAYKTEQDLLAHLNEFKEVTGDDYTPRHG